MPDGPAPLPDVIERKVKPDGSVREYRCAGVHMAADLAVVRFVIEEPSLFDTPVQLERGSTSDGWFWKRQPYSIYRFRSPDGTVAAHRFDAVTGVEIAESAITYRDLVLDWWVLPGGAVLEEDREELEELRASGVLSAAQYERALRAARMVLSRYRHIIDELEATERRLGIWPGT